MTPGSQVYNDRIPMAHDDLFSFHHFRFHLEPKNPLGMPAYDKSNVIWGGFGSTFRGSCVMQTTRTVLVIVLVSGDCTADLETCEGCS